MDGCGKKGAGFSDFLAERDFVSFLNEGFGGTAEVLMERDIQLFRRRHGFESFSR
jgi:hypothetical protein